MLFGPLVLISTSYMCHMHDIATEKIQVFDDVGWEK